MMNIVYISKYTSFPKYGSAGRQYFLSKHLTNNCKEDNVLLIGSQSSFRKIPKFKGLALEEQDGNFKTTILRGIPIDRGFSVKRILSWFQFEFNIWRYRKKIKSFKPDIIIVSSLSILSFISGVFLKRWFKIPLVLEVRDIHPLTLIEVGGYSKKHPAILFLNWIEKFGYKNADLLISTLPNADMHFKKVLKKSFKFKWLPMGVDLDYFDVVTEKSGLYVREGDEFIIGYAGAIGRANALDVIFETAKSLEKSHKHIKFAFVGDGPLKEDYIKKYGHLKNVLFHDFVPKQELQNILIEMDIVINTWLDRSIYKYGISPNKWIDYMYAAKPILLALNGYEQILKDSNCGVHVDAENEKDLRNAIIMLSEMPKNELEQMGRNGKDYLLKNLQYKDLAKELKDVLVEIVDN